MDSLQLLGMKNWTHAIPNEHEKTVFESVLRILPNNAKILEIGSYTGTSLVGMLNILPEATAIAVDIWDLDHNELDLVRTFAGEDFEMSDVKRAFYNNLKISGIEDRVSTIEMSSIHALRQLNEKGNKFDFIYIDGSHQCLDVVSDIVLSWQLLNPEGVMGLDDVLWSPDFKTVLNHPEHAVRWFFEQYAGKYNLLYSGYRVFVQKKCLDNI